jgi:aryl-alcohol dehydrogenase-like predicted oxidoreductase
LTRGEATVASEAGRVRPATSWAGCNAARNAFRARRALAPNIVFAESAMANVDAHRVLLPSTRTPILPIVFGTLYVEEEKADYWLAQLDRAFEAGINCFDTALVYDKGGAERVLGRWMRTRGIRGQVVVVTKGCHPLPNRPRRLNGRDLREDIEGSLERLQSDYVDAFLFHRDDPEVPAGDAIEMLQDFVAAGQVLTVGASNWSRERVARANEHARARQLRRIEVVSPAFSLAVPRDGNPSPFPGCLSMSGPDFVNDRAWYREAGISVLAWSALGDGFFSGRFQPDSYERFLSSAPLSPWDDAFWADFCARAYCHPQNFERLRRATLLANEKGCSLAQLALAYVLCAEAALPVVSARDEHLRENVGALDVALSPAELSWLEVSSDALSRD